MAPCKLCISTIFDVGSSADERTEVAELVSLYSWTFTASCYTAVYKKIQKLYFLKGRILYLSLLVQNIRQQGSRHWSLNPCSSPENYLDQHLGFPEAWNCPDFQLASTAWTHSWQFSAANSAKEGVAQVHVFLIVFFVVLFPYQFSQFSCLFTLIIFCSMQEKSLWVYISHVNAWLTFLFSAWTAYISVKCQ